MLPGERSLFDQGKFITGYLDAHFACFEQAGISYLCFIENCCVIGALPSR